jgi:hypothetical protein
MMINNEDASSGGLLAFITILLFCGFLTAMLGMGIDALVATHNAMIGGFPTSQDSINTGVNLVTAFRGLTFMLLLALGLNYLSVAQQEQTGNA